MGVDCAEYDSSLIGPAARVTRDMRAMQLYHFDECQPKVHWSIDVREFGVEQ